MVTGLDIGDVGADCLDDASRLVAGHTRHRGVMKPLDEVEIGVAHPGGRCADPDLAGTRVVDVDLFDRERCTRLSEDSGSHDQSFLARGGVS